MIQCLYTCDACGLEDVAVDVPEREANQDVVYWLQHVAVSMIGADHRIRSPSCAATKITALKIPVPDGTQRIGEVPRS